MAKRSPGLVPELRETLVFLAKTPFSSATDYSILTQRAQRTASNSLRRLLTQGLVDCHTYATSSLSWQKLYWITTRGLRTAVQEGFISDDESRQSAAITQSLSGRVETAAVITRVATDLVTPFDTSGEIVHAPARYPYNALIRVGRGWAAVFRQSYAESRDSLRRRIVQYRGDPRFALILAPTVSDRRAIEHHLWRGHQIDACMTFEGMLGAVHDGLTSWYRPGYGFINESAIVGLFPTSKPELPRVRGRTSPLRSIRRGFQYGTPVKRLLKSLVDWPLVRKYDLIKLLQMDGPSLSRAVSKAGDLVQSRKGFLQRDGDTVRLCLSPEGIEFVARRDLVKPSELLDKLSLEEDRNYAVPYRGSRIRQWVRQSLHDDHVASVTGDIVRSFAPEWNRYDIIPSPRSAVVVRAGNSVRGTHASNLIDEWRRHTVDRPRRRLRENRPVSFRPDAFVLLQGDTPHPLWILLEVERGARVPAALERRLETYLVHSLLRPDERSARIVPLWVFEDAAVETTVRYMVRDWCNKTRRRPFIATSNVDLIRDQGALGRAWNIGGERMHRTVLHEVIDRLDPPLHPMGLL